MIIETNNLYLRELNLNDASNLAKVLSDADSMKYYPRPFNQEEVENWINWNINNYAEYNHGLWAVILKENNLLIGDCGITMQNIDGTVAPEIGFHIIKDYCNKGYATEAANACKEYAFNHLGYDQIFSYSTIDNIPSQKVAKKIGMKVHKTFSKNDQQHIVQIAYRY